MSLRQGMWKRVSIVAVAALTLAGCGSPDGLDPTGEIPFTPERPTLPGSGITVTPYTGTDPYVLEAQTTYRTGTDLQRKLVLRTCGPTNGVCHNQKEYPDLHTEATFAAAIGAPCNVQPGSFNAVFDRCERLGDRFKFRDASWKELEVGYIDWVQGEFVDYTGENLPTADSIGLHVVLSEPLPGDERRFDETAIFIRNFVNAEGNVESLPFASFDSQWWVLEDRRHLVAEVRGDRGQENVESLLGSGIVQGDQNRNGTFGARQGNSVTLLNPGKPEESYLVARLRGEMQGQRVLGSRMPLANQPPSVVDMLALMCFLEGLQPSAVYDLQDEIDYAGCSYIADPPALSLFGSGDLTWRQRIFPLLSANCGGCHGGSSPEEGLDLSDPEGYAALIAKSSNQMPELKLIMPGDPQQSYLWRKVSGDGNIEGNRMPYDPFSGFGKLPPEDIDDITNWILQNAPIGTAAEPTP